MAGAFLKFKIAIVFNDYFTNTKRFGSNLPPFHLPSSNQVTLTNAAISGIVISVSECDPESCCISYFTTIILEPPDFSFTTLPGLNCLFILLLLMLQTGHLKIPFLIPDNFFILYFIKFLLPQLVNLCGNKFLQSLKLFRFLPHSFYRYCLFLTCSFASFATDR
jgi:hypothetical protein